MIALPIFGQCFDLLRFVTFKAQNYWLDDELLFETLLEGRPNFLHAHDTSVTIYENDSNFLFVVQQL